MKENTEEIVWLIFNVAESVLGPAATFFKGVLDFELNKKQRRTQAFIEHLLEQSEKALGEPLTHQHFENDNLHDILIAVVRNATETDSKYKQSRFVQIILNKIKDPKPLDKINLYIELTNNLSESHISVLTRYRDAHTMDFHVKSIQMYKEALIDINSQLVVLVSSPAKLMSPTLIENQNEKLAVKREINEKIQKNEEALKEFKHLYKPKTHNLEKDDYNYIMTDLRSKGLVEDCSTPISKITGEAEYVITPFWM